MVTKIVIFLILGIIIVGLAYNLLDRWINKKLNEDLPGNYFDDK